MYEDTDIYESIYIYTYIFINEIYIRYIYIGYLLDIKYMYMDIHITNALVKGVYADVC